MTTPFIPHDGPQTDFLITTADSPQTREILTSLGAHAVVHANYTAYVWDSRFQNIFISGAGVLDSRFYLGPRPLAAMFYPS